MFEAIDRRLVQAKEQVRTKRKLEAMLTHVQEQLRQSMAIHSKLKEQLASDKADVDKLDSLSLTAVFYTVLGTKREHLEQEKKEYLAAKLKHDESAEAVDQLQAECKRLREELNSLSSADQEYTRLIKEKESLLTRSHDARADILLGLSERLADLTSEKRELTEAIQAGEVALRALRDVQTDLGSAANWGTWDLLGGGLLTTMAKHSKIDSAKNHAHAAQRHLRTFEKELADAQQRLNVSLEIGGFATFADFFFDGLIADWVVQSKLQEASSACSTAISQVTSAVHKCRHKLAEAEREAADVDEQRRKCIEEA